MWSAEAIEGHTAFLPARAACPTAVPKLQGGQRQGTPPHCLAPATSQRADRFLKALHTAFVGGFQGDSVLPSAVNKGRSTGWPSPPPRLASGPAAARLSPARVSEPCPQAGRAASPLPRSRRSRPSGSRSASSPLTSSPGEASVRMPLRTAL